MEYLEKDKKYKKYIVKWGFVLSFFIWCGLWFLTPWPMFSIISGFWMALGAFQILWVWFFCRTFSASLTGEEDYLEFTGFVKTSCLKSTREGASEANGTQHGKGSSLGDKEKLFKEIWPDLQTYLLPHSHRFSFAVCILAFSLFLLASYFLLAFAPGALRASVIYGAGSIIAGCLGLMLLFGAMRGYSLPRDLASLFMPVLLGCLLPFLAEFYSPPASLPNQEFLGGLSVAKSNLGSQSVSDFKEKLAAEDYTKLTNNLLEASTNVESAIDVLVSNDVRVAGNTSIYSGAQEHRYSQYFIFLLITGIVPLLLGLFVARGQVPEVPRSYRSEMYQLRDAVRDLKEGLQPAGHAPISSRLEELNENIRSQLYRLSENSDSLNDEHQKLSGEIQSSLHAQFVFILSELFGLLSKPQLVKIAREYGLDDLGDLSKSELIRKIAKRFSAIKAEQRPVG